MQDLLYKLKSANRDLKMAEIKGLLYILINTPDLTNTSLIQLTGLPKETLKSFKNSFSLYLEDPKGDEIVLNFEGISVLKPLVLKSFPWTLVTFENEEIENKLIDIRKKHNLEPKRQFDQFFATERSTISKATVLNEKHVLKDKRICFLGDDDLVSITLGLLKADYEEIVIFDIDSQILTTIEDLALKLGIENITTCLYDARKPIKPAFLNKFDIVCVDPPYTKTGISLFLNRAISFLKHSVDDSGPHIHLFYGNSFKEPEKTLKIQEIIQRFNLVIEDKVDKFVRYNGAESIGSASSLYILKKTKHTVELDDYLGAEIYTFENTYTDNFPFVEHFVFKLYGVPQSIVTSKKGLQKACGQFCKWHKLNVVDTKITKFKGGGLTFTYVLSQSNLLVHTWPERKALHIDLVVCSPLQKKEMLLKNLSDLFHTDSIEVKTVE